MKPVDYDYSPTFLGGVGSLVDYRHQKFCSARADYEALLNKVRVFELDIGNEPVCVQTFSESLGCCEDGIDNWHPQRKAAFYSEIAEYIDINSSEDWIFARVEEDIEGYPDPYDDFTKYVLEVKVYATIKQRATLEQQETYKGLVKQLEKCFDRLRRKQSRIYSSC